LDLKELLKRHRKGGISDEELLKGLKMDHLETLEGKFRYDLARENRIGFPEAILGLRKTAEDIGKILKRILPLRDRVFVTRLDEGKMETIRSMLEDSGLLDDHEFEYHRDPKLLLIRRKDSEPPDLGRSVGIMAGGTSDISVAEEARLILQESGVRTIPAYDVGVAGIHRLLEPLKRMLEDDVDVIIVVAGMEGALPSVIKGLVEVPVIGVPTSVGYGYRAGETALMSMLSSCVPGLTVTNIDNGFGAAAAAHSICSRVSKAERRGASGG